MKAMGDPLAEAELNKVKYTKSAKINSPANS